MSVLNFLSLNGFGRIRDLFTAVLSALILLFAVILFSKPVFADSNWNSARFNQSHSFANKKSLSEHENQYSRYSYSSYKGYADPYGTPLAKQYYSIQSPVNQQAYDQNYGYSHQQYYPRYPQQNSVTIIYNHQLPTQTEYHSESHGFVNGDPNGRIESSSYMLISDWKRYNLPAPNVGMHWIYKNGHYLQMPNNR